MQQIDFGFFDRFKAKPEPADEEESKDESKDAKPEDGERPDAPDDAEDADTAAKMKERLREAAQKASESTRTAFEGAKQFADNAKERVADSEYAKTAEAKAEEIKQSKLGGQLKSFSNIMAGVFGIKQKRGSGYTGAGAGPNGEYPWTEFKDPETEDRLYHNAHTGRVSRIKPEDFDEFGNSVYDQPIVTETAVMIVEEKQSRWNRIMEKLKDTPIINSVMAAAQEVAQSEPVQKTKTAIKDKKEDMQTKWETSQNPWVYRASSAFDSVFSENEWGQSVREIKALDSGFDMLEFIDEMKDVIVPQVIGAFLRGDRDVLKFWCAETAMAQLSAALKAREMQGLSVDPSILSQINCIRDRSNAIVEGGEDEIRAFMYAIAMSRVYDEHSRKLNWKVAEIAIIGNQLYL